MNPHYYTPTDKGPKETHPSIPATRAYFELMVKNGNMTPEEATKAFDEKVTPVLAHAIGGTPQLAQQNKDTVAKKFEALYGVTPDARVMQAMLVPKQGPQEALRQQFLVQTFHGHANPALAKSLGVLNPAAQPAGTATVPSGSAPPPAAAPGVAPTPAPEPTPSLSGEALPTFPTTAGGPYGRGETDLSGALYKAAGRVLGPGPNSPNGLNYFGNTPKPPTQ
jgi:hypothetical protein